MNLTGTCIGAALGATRGGGFIGAIIGAIAGNWVEEKLRASLRKKAPPPPETPEPGEAFDPYEILGCPHTASNEEISKAYREKAKQLHPDALRAQGLPDDAIAEANGRMSLLNAAWSAIKRERRI